MPWIHQPGQVPAQDDRYVVTVGLPFQGGTLYTIAVAMYNTQTQTWHQVNPFHIDRAIGADVTDLVKAWLSDGGNLAQALRNTEALP